MKLINNFDNRCTRIEKELHQFLNLLAKNEEIVENERNRILEIVQELSNVVFSHRSRINQLLRINKQQEGLLFSQCALIKKKVRHLKAENF